MSQRDSNYPIIIGAGTQQTNPAQDATIADTGAISYHTTTGGGTGGPGIYEVLVVAGASAAAVMRVEHRNKANSSTTDSILFYVPAGSTVTVPLRFYLDADATAGERVRVAMVAALTGTAAAAIQLQKVG